MKYIFVCPDMDFLRIQYSDFEHGRSTIDTDFVKMSGFYRKIAKALNKKHFYRTWISDYVFRRNLENSFASVQVEENKEYCFILYSRSYEDYRSIITRYLRKKYKKCRIVVYYGDLLSSHYCNLQDVREEVDDVFTFDQNEAIKYGLKWLLEPFSSSVTHEKIFSSENNPFMWDFTFVGRAKGRYYKIIEIYERLTKEGYNCDFHITGVREKDRRYKKSISYKSLDFTNIIRHVISSKCIVEVMQDGGESPTTRYTEAMLFGRNLLTDCKAFINEEDKPINVAYYNESSSIDKKMMEKLVDIKEFDRTGYIKDFSIQSMIHSINKYMDL